MIIEIKSLIADGDIVPNLIETFPKELQKEFFDEEQFYSILQNKNNCICYHITRLTQNELNDIETNGIKFGSKELLSKRIGDLPNDYKKTKEFLFRNLEIEFQNNSDEVNPIFAFYGFLDFKDNVADINSFCRNWGGEAIYRYIDKNDGFKDTFLKKVHNDLQKISRPYLIVLRTDESIPAITQSGNIYNDFIHSNLRKTFGSFALSKIPKIVTIVDLTEIEVVF